MVIIFELEMLKNDGLQLGFHVLMKGILIIHAF